MEGATAKVVLGIGSGISFTVEVLNDVTLVISCVPKRADRERSSEAVFSVGDSELESKG